MASPALLTLLPRAPGCSQVDVDFNDVIEKAMGSNGQNLPRPLKGWDATAGFKLIMKCDEWLPTLQAHPKYELLKYWARERRYQMRFLKQTQLTGT